MPRVSIGIPTFKRPEFLKRSISSVLAQTYTDFEILVGNNDVSVPLSGELMGIHDPRVRWINHSTNLGQVGNVNALLAQARGGHFAWLMDDDLFAPDYLEAAIESLKSGAQAYYSDYLKGSEEPDWEAVLSEQPSSVRCMPGKEWIKGLIFRDLKTIGCYGVWEIDRLRAIRGYRQLGNGVSPFSDVLISIYAGELERVAFSSKPQNFLRTHDQSLSWTTSEAEPYSTAQMDLQAEVFPILKRTLGPDFQRSCAEFLRHWCAEYFFSILERGRLSQWTEIGPYVSWISSVCGVLSVRQRLKLYFQVGFYFFRLIKRSSISRLRRLMKPA